MFRRQFFALVAGCAVALAVAGPATASPNAVRPNSVTQFACRNGSGWSYVQNRPGGYVIGNCADGVHLDQDSSVPPQSPNGTGLEYGGLVHGNFNYCGWVLAANLTGARSTTAAGCAAGTVSTLDSDVTQNGDTALNCELGICSDGTYTQTIAACPRYANVRPWLATGEVGVDRVTPDFPAGSTSQVWRYVTRDGSFVMTHNTSDNTWFFVPRSCLPRQLPHSWSDGPFYGDRGTAFADVDGDPQHKADAIAVNNGGIYVRTSDGNGWRSVPTNNWTGGAFYGDRGTMFADVNGDGRADAIAVNNSGIGVATSTGSSFGTTAFWSGPFYGDRGTMFADLNADGRADAIAVNNTGIGVALSTGTSFGTTQFWSGPLYGTRGTFFADVNNDGRADAIVVNDSAVSVALNNGGGFNLPTDWSHLPFYGSYGTFFADVNGDGRADAIAVNGDKTMYRLSTGVDFAPNTEWTQQPAHGTAPIAVGPQAGGNGQGGDPDTSVVMARANGDSSADSIAVYGPSPPSLGTNIVTYGP